MKREECFGNHFKAISIEIFVFVQRSRSVSKIAGSVDDEDDKSYLQNIWLPGLYF